MEGPNNLARSPLAESQQCGKEREMTVCRGGQGWRALTPPLIRSGGWSLHDQITSLGTKLPSHEPVGYEPRPNHSRSTGKATGQNKKEEVNYSTEGFEN
jgi:hypothetical protein